LFRKEGKTKSCENCKKNKKRCGLTEESSKRVRRARTEEKGKESEKVAEEVNNDGGQMEGTSERVEKTVEAERTERTEGTAETGMTRVSGMEARILRRLDRMEKTLTEISGEVSELYDMLDPGWVWETEMAQTEESEQESEESEMDWEKELKELEAENGEAEMDTEE
jgi:hypothetical protein